MLCLPYVHPHDAMTIIASGRGKHSERTGMTTANSTTIVQLSNDEFIPKMEELLANEAVSKIDVAYYQSGGCNLKAYVGKAYREFHIPKPANKIGRFNGEIGWLTAHRTDVRATIKSGLEWQQYIIERLDSETSPETTISVETPAPVVEEAPRDVYVPKWMKQGEEKRKTNDALAVVLHEMAQYQVDKLQLSIGDENESSAVYFVAFDNDNLVSTSTHHIVLEDNSVKDAIAYVLDNRKYFEARFVCSLDAVLDIRGNVSALVFTRLPELKGLSIPDRENYLANLIFLNDSTGYWKVQDFMERHLKNDALRSLSIFKKRGHRSWEIHARVGSATVLYFVSNDDFKEMEEYIHNNLHEIMWDGFTVKRPTIEDGAALESAVNISRTASADVKDGFLIATNLPLFAREFMENVRDYEFHLHVGDKDSSITTFDTGSDKKTTFDVTVSVGEVKDFVTWFSIKAEDFQKEYNVQIQCLTGDGWGYSIKIHKNIRFNKDFYTKESNVAKEAFEFLQQAYDSGLNIVVQGKAGVGKTDLLSTLAENSADDSLTVFVDTRSEIRIPDHKQDVVVISGNAKSSLNAALKVSAQRVLFDSPGEFDGRDFFARIADKNVQIVMTTLESTSDTFKWMKNSKTEYPFAIEVTFGFIGKIDSISQISTANGVFGTNVLWERKEGVLSKEAAPSRNIRRKIEANVNTKPNVAKAVKTVASGVAEQSKLVTLSDSEKREILGALETLKSFVNRF